MYVQFSGLQTSFSVKEFSEPRSELAILSRLSELMIPIKLFAGESKSFDVSLGLDDIARDWRTATHKRRAF